MIFLRTRFFVGLSLMAFSCFAGDSDTGTLNQLGSAVVAILKKHTNFSELGLGSSTMFAWETSIKFTNCTIEGFHQMVQDLIQRLEFEGKDGWLALKADVASYEKSYNDLLSSPIQYARASFTDGSNRRRGAWIIAGLIVSSSVLYSGFSLCRGIKNRFQRSDDRNEIQ